MEYLIGALVTTAIFIVVGRMLRFNIKEAKDLKITYSQSHIYSLILPFIPSNSEMSIPKKSQSNNHYNNIYIRTIIYENKAYWIKESNFFVADLVNGEIDKASQKQVDTLSMDKVQLDKMMFIIDKLMEGKDNDSRYSG
jgi:hypothetical protein